MPSLCANFGCLRQAFIPAQVSTPLSQTTEPSRQLVTLSSALSMPNPPRWLRNIGTGSSHSALSSEQCSSFTPTEKLSLSAMENTSQHISPALIQGHMAGLSTLTSQYVNGQGKSTVYHLTSLKSSSSLKSGTCTVKLQQMYKVVVASDETRGQWMPNPSWRSRDPCWLHNLGKCAHQASECKYRHMCTRCGRGGHVERECPTKKD